MIRINLIFLTFLMSSVTKGTERDTVAGEITPVSAEQTRTSGSYEAGLAIDRDMSTLAYALSGDDGTTWLKVKLGQVYCVDMVVVYYYSTYFSYSCTREECTCETNCGGYLLSVHTEGTTSSGNLQHTNGCRLGDTVKLYREDGRGIPVYELVITDKLADCTVLDSTWDVCNVVLVTDPQLPVEHDTVITLRCGGDFTNTGGSEASCQNGSIVLTDKPPSCLAPCTAGNYMPQCGCRECPGNTFSAPGATGCTGCPDGKVSGAGSTSVDNCQYEEEEKEDSPLNHTVAIVFGFGMGVLASLLVVGLISGGYFLYKRYPHFFVTTNRREDDRIVMANLNISPELEEGNIPSNEPTPGHTVAPPIHPPKVQGSGDEIMDETTGHLYIDNIVTSPPTPGHTVAPPIHSHPPKVQTRSSGDEIIDQDETTEHLYIDNIVTIADEATADKDDPIYHTHEVKV